MNKLEQKKLIHQIITVKFSKKLLMKYLVKILEIAIIIKIHLQLILKKKMIFYSDKLL